MYAAYDGRSWEEAKLNKKSYRWLLGAAMLAVLLTFASGISQAQSGVTIVTNVNLNLRAAPSTESDSLGTVPQGTTLDALALSTDRAWVAVYYESEAGWLSLSYVGVTAGNLNALPVSDTAPAAEAAPPAEDAPPAAATPPPAAPLPIGEIVRIEANPEAGFYWPYLVYVPGALGGRSNDTLYMLVEGNNTGYTTDDYSEHERSANELIDRRSEMARRLGIASLIPIFPRWNSQSWLYTHALDREVLTTDIPELSRLDLQLLAMIDDARARMAAAGLTISEQVLLYGYSASGMFANRFALLHPDRAFAVAVGAPGGWAMAPTGYWEGRTLTYPVGVADLEGLTGQPFDGERFLQVPHFLFLGDQDTNDAVPFESFDDGDRAVIYELFGMVPVERWDDTVAIWTTIGANVQFRLYEGLQHGDEGQMMPDVYDFFRSVLAAR